MILMGPGHRGAVGTPAWSQELGYDMFNWDRLEYPFGDWLTLTDLELFTGDIPRHFSGSIRFNQLLRQINRDIGLLHLEEGSLLGFPDQDDSRADIVLTWHGRSVRELALLDQAVFYSELGVRPGQGSIDDEVLLQCRTLVTRKAPLNFQVVDEKISESRNQDNTGRDIDRSLLNMIDPMTIPVSFIVWTYVWMCEELQCSLHMRGHTHDIFKWWIMEALQYTPRYETAVQAYYRMVISSSMVQTNRGLYQVRDVIYVRDLLLFTAVMYLMDAVDQEYVVDGLVQGMVP